MCWLNHICCIFDQVPPLVDFFGQTQQIVHSSVEFTMFSHEITIRSSFRPCVFNLCGKTS